MKTCPQCQTLNPPDANFCTGCRAPLARTSVSNNAYCERGNAIDPSWPECYQCKAEQQQADAGIGAAPPRMPTVMETPAPQRQTVMEGALRVQRDTAEPTGRTTGPAPAAPPRRVTQFVPSAPPPPPRVVPLAGPGPVPAASPAAPTADPKTARRIVGVLITYTWKPEGQIFPIREGRNLIGRSPEKCDIALPEDPNLSEINSHITFRRTFTVGDMVSMSGTDLNGTPVEESYVRLPNYASLRTGSTHWTFIEAQPAPRTPEET